MDIFIGAMVLVLVGALISGAFVLAGTMLGYGKYTHRGAGISLLALSVIQAFVILAMIANPYIRTYNDSIAEMVQPMFWTTSNLIAGIALVVMAHRQNIRNEVADHTVSPQNHS